MKKSKLLAVLPAILLAAALTGPALAWDESDTSPYDSIRITEDDMNLLCATVQAEAGNQKEEGKEAVAQVILNRVLNGYWGDTVRKVISAPGQFATYPYCDGGWFSASTERAVEKVLRGEVQVSYGTLYFSRGLVPGTKYGCRIGDHVFSK